jgi:hypothetical protein
MFQDIAARGAEAAAFRPFTVSTGFGGVTTTPEGGFTTTLSPAMAAQQQALQGITSGLIGGMGGPSPAQRFEALLQTSNDTSPMSFRDTLTGEVVSQEQMQAITGAPPQAPMAPSTGGFGAGIPDVSGITGQALGGVGGFLTGAMAPMGAREADVYERIRATQRPEEQRAQLALEERLAAQGRTGLRTAQFGGSPEQLALAQAQEEAKARASLAALEQAQAEQMQQVALAESLFGLGGRAAGLPQALQLGQLQNIGLAQAAQYQPEQELLASLTPAITLANIANTGQQYGAKTMTGVEAAGLENLLEAEQRRSSDLASIYGDILGAAAAQRQGQPQTSIVSDVSGLFSALRDFF